MISSISSSALVAVRRAATLTLLALILTSCGDASPGASGPTPTPAAPVDGALAVRASEWEFEPRAIALQRGEEVRIVLENGGDILHNLKIEGELTADVIESRSSGGPSAQEGELFVWAGSGDEGTLIFVPKSAGTYTFYCTIDRHRALGMEGTLTVAP